LTEANDPFSELLSREDGEIELARACLQIAADAYPGLDVDGYVGEIERFAKRLRARLGIDAALEDRIIALNEFLFDDLGFGGNADDYYDPRNSCLNDVLDRQLGIPITLSVLIMEVGRRVGLEILGIGLPGHFCVGARVGEELVLFDPFGGGRRLERAEAEAIASRAVGRPVEFTDAHFAPATKAQIVVRMLRNLQGIYARREDWAKALAVIDRLLVIEADAPMHVRDRGTVLVKLGELHRGASEWERYLTRYPQARDAAAFKEELRRIRQTLAERN
jgi:regulator of sirC expression with transglutaminase-like and TPR domain